MPNPLSKKLLLALFFCVIGLVLMMASLFIPWWGMKSSVVVGDETHTSGGGLYYISGASLYSSDSSVLSLCGATLAMAVLAIMFTTLTIVSILFFAIGMLRSKKLPLIMGILMIVFAIVAPAVFAAGLPGAIKKDDQKQAGEDYEAPGHTDPSNSFFGSYNVEDSRYTWGGDSGWVMSLLAFIFLLLGLIFVLITKTASVVPPEEPPHREPSLYEPGPAHVEPSRYSEPAPRYSEPPPASRYPEMPPAREEPPPPRYQQPAPPPPQPQPRYQDEPPRYQQQAQAPPPPMYHEPPPPRYQQAQAPPPPQPAPYQPPSDQPPPPEPQPYGGQPQYGRPPPPRQQYQY